ncbi:hypothetical protein KKH56_04195 [bacterium]|nr:hypothetical protein [bacterium]
MKNKKMSLVAIALVTVMSSSAMASDFTDTLKSKKVAVGFQNSLMSWGLSGKMQLSDKWTAQGVIGALGTFTSFSGRGLYKLQSDKYWEMYGFGQAGVWMWGGGRGYDSETTFGFGGGAGVEGDWRALSPKLPPLYWNIEAGLGVISWENYSGFSIFNFGSGVHYKF